MNKTFKKIVAMAAVVGMSLPMAVVPAFAATVTKYYADVDEITITYSEDLKDVPTGVTLADSNGTIATTASVSGKNLILKPTSGEFKRDHLYNITTDAGKEYFKIKTIVDTISADTFATSGKAVFNDGKVIINGGTISPNGNYNTLSDYSVKFSDEMYLIKENYPETASGVSPYFQIGMHESRQQPSGAVVGLNMQNSDGNIYRIGGWNGAIDFTKQKVVWPNIGGIKRKGIGDKNSEGKYTSFDFTADTADVRAITSDLTTKSGTVAMGPVDFKLTKHGEYDTLSTGNANVLIKSTGKRTDSIDQTKGTAPENMGGYGLTSTGGYLVIKNTWGNYFAHEISNFVMTTYEHINVTVLAPVKYYADEDGMTIEFNKDLTSFTNINGIVVKQNEVEVPTTATKDGKVITLTPAEGAKFAKDVLSTVTIPAGFGTEVAFTTQNYTKKFKIKTVSYANDDASFREAFGIAANSQYKYIADGNLYLGRGISPVAAHNTLQDYSVEMKFRQIAMTTGSLQLGFSIYGTEAGKIGPGFFLTTTKNGMHKRYYGPEDKTTLLASEHKNNSWKPLSGGNITMIGFTSQENVQIGQATWNSTTSTYTFNEPAGNPTVTFNFEKHGTNVSLAAGTGKWNLDANAEHSIVTGNSNEGLGMANCDGTGYFSIVPNSSHAMIAIEEFVMTTFVDLDNYEAITATKFYADVDEIQITFNKDTQTLENLDDITVKQGDTAVAVNATAAGKVVTLTPITGKFARDTILTVTIPDTVGGDFIHPARTTDTKLYIKTIVGDVTDFFEDQKGYVGLDEENKIAYVIGGQTPKVSTAAYNEYSVKFDAKPYLYEDKDRMYFAFGWQASGLKYSGLSGWTTYNPNAGLYPTNYYENETDTDITPIGWGVAFNPSGLGSFKMNSSIANTVTNKEDGVSPYVTVSPTDPRKYASFKVKKEGNHGTVSVGGESSTLKLADAAVNGDFYIKVYFGGYGVAEVANLLITTCEVLEEGLVLSNVTKAGVGVSFDINKVGADASYPAWIVLAAYDTNNKLLGAQIGEYTVSSTQTGKTLTIDGVDESKVKSLKLFVWNGDGGLSTGMKPYESVINVK